LYDTSRPFFQLYDGAQQQFDLKAILMLPLRLEAAAAANVTECVCLMNYKLGFGGFVV
jgi:hypothetical protein